MAEDDDDWTFGEFASASFQSNSQHNGPKSFVGNKEDDEWGDFVKSPQQSNPSDPSFNGYHQSDNSASPSPLANRVGALPLSIFGDAEEEVDNSGISGDVNEGKNSGFAGDLNSSLAHSKVSNNRNFSIADLYNRYPEIKPENGHGSISTGSFDLVEKGFHLSLNQNGAGSAFTEMKNMDLNDTVVVIDGSQLTNKIDIDEFNFKSNVTDPSKNGDLFGGWPQEFRGFSSNLDTTLSMQPSSSDLQMNGPNQELDGSDTAIDDDGDDGWEFKDAYSEMRMEEVNNNKVDLVANKVSEKNMYSSGVAGGSNNSLDLFGTPNGSISFFPMSNVSVDYFATSSGISGTSQEVGFIGIQPSTANANGFTIETSSVIEQINIEGPSNHSTDVGSAEFDESFTESTIASAVAGPKPREVSTNGFLFPSTYADAVSTPDGKTQEKDTNLDYHKGAIPLSIFGDEKLESGGSSDAQDVHLSTSEQRNSHIPNTAISINDLISSLYSQAEHTSSTNTVHKSMETQLSLSNAVSSSDVVNGDDLDDGSWDFKDADDLDGGSWDFKDASQTIVDSESTISTIGDTHMSTKLKLNSYLDFYSKLKEELCFVIKFHIESLKQAQGTAALSGEDAGAASIDTEFQLACKELEQMNFLFDDSTLHDHPAGDSYLNQFAQVLLEPQFQLLESEYHLSQKLLLVKKDLRSAMELLRHTTTMIKILTITPEEQRAYISIWIEMISACAQELKHGASIWNQAVKKHLQSQLLSETQGRKFFLALGEIYRVVVVLGASAELFKPWTLSGSVDNPAIYSLLEECHAVWSSSGLEEALSIVSAPTALDSTSLFKSIKHILGLDALILQNYVFAETGSRCWLSILTAGVAPGMKMITWRNEQCFVTLANLWANLVRHNPPKLPQLNLG